MIKLVNDINNIGQSNAELLSNFTEIVNVYIKNVINPYNTNYTLYLKEIEDGYGYKIIFYFEYPFIYQLKDLKFTLFKTEFSSLEELLPNLLSLFMSLINGSKSKDLKEIEIGNIPIHPTNFDRLKEAENTIEQFNNEKILVRDIIEKQSQEIYIQDNIESLSLNMNES